MRDLTQGSVRNHVLLMAAPIAVTMLTYIACQLINLYFVAKVGTAAAAGVNLAGNVIFVVSAACQVLSVGTAALVARAAGSRDQAGANLTFNQSLLLSVICGLVTLLLLYTFGGAYLRSVAADAATVEAGLAYLNWVIPGFALLFPWTVLGAALRGTGVVRPTTIIYVCTVVINAALAPILIVGWGTDRPFGVRGAGLTTSIAMGIGVVLLLAYQQRVGHFLTIRRELLHPRPQQWRRVLNIGLPTGAEFLLTFLSTAVVYYTIRNFGAAAQAGYGIGSQILQTVLAPAIAVSLAAGPVVGQNFGAKSAVRVRETFRSVTLIVTSTMLVTTMLLQWRAESLLAVFDVDAAAIAFGAVFLQLRSWSFVAQGLVHTCSTVFQSLGNTIPALISSSVRFLAFVAPAVWLSKQPQFQIEHVWYLWVGSVMLQAALSLWFLRSELRTRLSAAP